MTGAKHPEQYKETYSRMYKILIAEDEAIERNYLTQFIEGTGDYSVVASVEDGLSAVELTLLHRPDLALLDIRMPLLDGLQAAEKIKHHLPQTFVILNSAYAEFEFAQKAIRCGVDAYLVKPSSNREILSVLRACLPPVQTRRADNADSPSLMEGFPEKALEDFRKSIQIGDLRLLEQALDDIAKFFERKLPLNVYRILAINIVFSLERTCFESPLFRPLLGNAAQGLIVQSIVAATDILTIQNIVLSCLAKLRSSASVLLQASIPAVRRITAYLDEHFREPVTSASLEKIVCLSGDYIERHFRRETGQSIAQYLRAKRVLEAKRLLSRSDMTLQDISEASGFGSLSTFYKVFRKAVHNTPAQYRKATRG